jgi:hypothetical protein
MPERAGKAAGRTAGTRAPAEAGRPPSRRPTQPWAGAPQGARCPTARRSGARRSRARHRCFRPAGATSPRRGQDGACPRDHLRPEPMPRPAGASADVPDVPCAQDGRDGRRLPAPGGFRPLPSTRPPPPSFAMWAGGRRRRPAGPPGPDRPGAAAGYRALCPNLRGTDRHKTVNPGGGAAPSREPAPRFVKRDGERPPEVSPSRGVACPRLRYTLRTATSYTADRNASVGKD